jgi:pimeloyl-ACP methyl ester carboxylesterase
MKKTTRLRLLFWILFILLILALIKISGKWLDKDAEKYVDQLYPRDAQGVTQGLQTITVIGQHEKTILILHGFFESPADFSDVIQDIKKRVPADIYAPLLPFQGRNLATAALFSAPVVSAYVNSYIDNLALHYKSVIVVGHSFGGALLVNLARQKKLPVNVQLVLYAPAIFIGSNDFAGRVKARVYNVWRDYCNYPLLGCRLPNYASGDAAARPYFDEEKTLRYVVAGAIMQLYAMDLTNRAYLPQIDRPYAVIMAEDDNRVSFAEQEKACFANKNFCTLYAFRGGRHFLHWGKNKTAFENLLVKFAAR